MKTALVVFSDLHVGSTVGLCPANVTLDDGGRYAATKAQLWLLDCWRRAWADVARLAAGYELWAVSNGDLCDGDHHGTYQLWSRNPEDQIRTACDMLSPVQQLAHRLFVVRGTEAHVGGSSWFEEAIAHRIDAEPCPVTATHSWYRLPIIVSGVRFHVAHHASMGGKELSRGTSAAGQATDTLTYCAEHGLTIPDVVVRSHNHRWADSGTTYRVRAVGMPAWQLGTAYINGRRPNSIADIGLCVWLCDAGRYTMHPIRFQPKEDRYWTSR